MIALAITDKVLSSPSFKAHLALTVVRTVLMSWLSMVSGLGEIVLCT